MKEGLMEILCCPVCKGELELEVRETDGDEVVEGTLRCGECPEEYEVSDGIPNLLPPDMRD